MLDLRSLLTHESELLEWKEEVADINDVVRTLVAFANDLANLGGGRVVCGAREIKDEHGFPRAEALGLTAQRLKEVVGKVLERCRSNVSPALAPQVEELKVEDPSRRVLVFTVVATGRAHALRDGERSAYWVRIGSQTREARNGVLLRLLSARGEVEPWDRRLALKATIEDLDLLALRETLIRMGSWDPSRPVDHWLDPEVRISTFMPSLCGREPLTGLLRPRNFALLLFGRDPQRHVPGAVAIFSLYPGPDRTEPYSERVMLDGTVLNQATQLIRRLNVEAIGLTDKSSGGESNASKYPVRALQEAVINGLVHRDYTMDDPLRVVAFSDRVDIWSPGGLDPRMDKERFQRGDVRPQWRNQALAWVFVKLKLAQSEGQGIPTILRSMELEGCPPARFELTEDSVACILPAHPRHARVRELQRIEQDVVLGRVSVALAALEQLLAQDPYNYRTVSLLAEVCRSLGDSSPALRFVLAHRASLHRFPAAAQLALADALLTSEKGRQGEHLRVARELLALAGAARGDLADTRRLVINLALLKDDVAALNELERAFSEHPTWREDPALLQLRGRAQLQLAKRARQSLKGTRLTPRLRERANAEWRSHLRAAEEDLRAALDHGAIGVVRDHAEDDLRYLARLKG